MTIKDLDPQLVWKNFYGLTQVPRPSKHEEKITSYLYNWGVSRGFETIVDNQPIGNVMTKENLITAGVGITLEEAAKILQRKLNL